MIDSKNYEKQIHIKLPSDLHQALRLEAALQNTTIQKIVQELIQQKVDQSNYSMSKDKK